jgi:hypothetical protein
VDRAHARSWQHYASFIEEINEDIALCPYKRLVYNKKMLVRFASRLHNKLYAQSYPTQPPGYNALIQIGTNVLLALHTSSAVIGFLRKCTSDTFHATYVNYPNYTDAFFLLGVPTAQYPEWTYDEKARVFVPTHADLLTPNLRSISQLAVAKGECLAIVLRNLNNARLRKSTGIAFQETIYHIKRLEAQAFRTGGYDEQTLMQYPYLLQYSDYAGISPREAADEILLKARLAEDETAKTEFLRMKYFKKIRDARQPEELAPIQEEFMRDLYITATL